MTNNGRKSREGMSCQMKGNSLKRHEHHSKKAMKEALNYDLLLTFESLEERVDKLHD